MGSMHRSQILGQISHGIRERAESCRQGREPPPVYFPPPLSSSGVNLLGLLTFISSEGALLARPCPDELALMRGILEDPQRDLWRESTSTRLITLNHPAYEGFQADVLF